MVVNKPKIVILGNVEDVKGTSNGEWKLKEGKNGKPDKIFLRTGSMIQIKKLFDKVRGIKDAPVGITKSLKETFNNHKIPFTNKSINEGVEFNTHYVPNFGKAGAYLSPDERIIFISKSINELQTETMELSSLSSLTNDVQKGFVPLPPTDDIGTPPPNDQPKPPIINQAQNKFNLEKNTLKNEFKVAIKKLIPINELKIGKDHKNYLYFIERLNHLVIEIESFSSYVVNQGIDIKHPGIDYLINSQKEELESEIRVVLSLSGKNDQEIKAFMEDFSTKLQNLTNQYLENGKV